MAFFAPAYRARIFAPKSVDATETTPLTPRAGALHTDPFQVSTIAGVSGYQPIMAVPTGRRCRIDPRSKKADIGSRSVTLLDRLINPSTSLRTERWLTQYYGDADGKTALGMCRYEEDESFDNGVSWTRLYTGRVTDIKTVGQLQFTASIQDMMGDLDADLFQGDPIEIAYARRLPLMPNAITESFLGLQPGSPPLPGEILGGTALVFQTQTGDHVDQLDPALQASLVITQRLVDLASQIDTIDAVQRLAQLTFEKGSVRLRMDHGGTISWWWVRQLQAPKVIIDGQSNEERHYVVMRVVASTAPELNASPATWPGNGEQVTWELHYPEIGTSATNPLIIDQVDPIQLVMDALDGKFGLRNPVTGDPSDAVARDSASWAALLGVFPPVRYVINEKKKRRDWITSEICQPFQVAISMNEFGQAVILDLRRGTDFADLPQITDPDIISAFDSEGSSQNTKDAIRRIVAKLAVVEQLDWIEAIGDVAPDWPTPPPGLLQVTLLDPPPVYDALGDPRSIDFGAGEISISFLGLATLPRSTVNNPLFYPEYKKRTTYVEKFAREILDLDGHGAQYITLRCRRSGVAEGTREGMRRILSTTTLPNPGTLLRGGPRVGLCIERTEEGPVVELVFKDLGVTDISDPPSGGPPASDEDDCAHTVELPVALNDAGDPVDVEWAATTIGGARPVDESGDWILAGQQTTDGTFVITGLPSGSRIHLRIRSHPLGSLGLPSAWTAPDPAFQDTCLISGPSGCALVGDLITWTLTRTDLQIQISIDAVPFIVLPPGTLSWSPVGHTGTISVDQIGPFGDIIAGCSVDVDLVDVPCVDADFHDARTDSTSEGSLAFIIDSDPQGYIVPGSLQFKTKPWNGLESAFAPGTPGTPVTVPVAADQISTITRSVQVTLCGGGTQTLVQTYTFTATSIPDPGSPGSGTFAVVPYPVVLWAGDPDFEIVDPPVEGIEIGEGRHRERISLGAGRVRAHVTVTSTDLPVGSFVVFKCCGQEGDSGSEVFVPIDGVDGPKIPVDATSVGTRHVHVSLPVAIASTNYRDVEIAAFVFSPDGTGTIVGNQLKCQIEFLPASTNPDPPDNTGPDPDPGGDRCILYPQPNGYHFEDLDVGDGPTEIFAAGFSLLDTAGIVVDLEIVATPDMDGDGKALKVTIDFPGAGDFVIAILKPVTGFTPGQPLVLSLGQYPLPTVGITWSTPDNVYTEVNTAGSDLFNADLSGVSYIGTVETYTVSGAVAGVVHYLDRFRLADPACIQNDGGTPDNPDPDPTLPAGLIFVEDGET